jgi:hypothetical protein
MRTEPSIPWKPLGIVISAELLALVFPTPIVSGAVFLVTLLCVLGCVLATSTWEGQIRPIWFGCSLFAAGYFLVAILLTDVWALGVDLGWAQRKVPKVRFATSYLLAWLFELLHPQNVPAVELLRIADKSHIPAGMNLTSFNSFMLVGHGIFTLLFGCLGAVFAEKLTSERQHVTS